MLTSFLLILLLAAACKKQGGGVGFGRGPFDHSSLKGDWRWVQETHSTYFNSPAYDTLTPASTMSVRSLHIGKDNAYLYKRAGMPDEAGQIILEVASTGDFPAFRPLEFQHNGKDSVINPGYMISHDSLYCYGALSAFVFYTVYVRVN